MDLLQPLENLAVSAQKRLGEVRFYSMLLGLLVLVGFLPLLIPGIPKGHDIYYHFSRLEAMTNGLRHGIFPVLINAKALGGYGYASGLFYPDLLLYPVGLLALTGIGTVAAYKIFLVAVGLACAYSAQYVVWRIGGSRFGAFAAGILYAWSSYFAVDLLIRAAVGEFTAFPFLPWIFLGLYEIIHGNPRRFLPLAIGFTGLVLAHNLSLLIMAIVTALMLAFHVHLLLRAPGRVAWVVVAAVLTVALGAFYLLPLAEQLTTTKFIVSSVAKGNIAVRAVPLTRLFLELPYMKLEYWIPHGIGVILIIVLLQRCRLTSSWTAPERYRDAMLIGGIVSLLAATNFLPWEGMFRVLAVLQFPWRSYLPATAFLALGGGLTLAALTAGDPVRERRWLGILLVGCGTAWWLNVGYIYAAKIYEGNMFKRFVPGAKQEASGVCYLPVGSEPFLYQTRGDVVLATPDLPVTVNRSKYGVLEVQFSDNTAGATLELPLFYYRGYQARLTTPDGKSRDLSLQSSGQHLAEIVLPEDVPAGTVTVRYVGSGLRRMAVCLSLTTFVVVVILVVWRRRRKAKAAAASDAATPQSM
ncbi:MAG: hypothetical protein GX574_11280 [Lentisphaerae bacterium]|mgnify:CR=1 FL=1|nr:hypothetical protein [Lentisphaerota bacterium]OQC12066.1 MAG: hypothetical protein BWX73_03227 [Lentisphaerae bacterium ADurb.Bin082]HQL87111.1 hypothetical protein [Lentisphaeria bacterium]